MLSSLRQFLSQRSLRGILIVLVTGVWTGVWAGGSFAQDRSDPTASDGWRVGYDLFQMLFEQHGLHVVGQVEQALLVPEESVIILLGDTNELDLTEYWRDLEQFVLGGGALLIASDRSFDRRGFGRFSQRVVSTTDRASQYQGFNDCLQISLISSSHRELSGVGQLVTNRSGWFEPRRAGWLDWEVVASLPDFCEPLAAQSQPLIAVGYPESSSGVTIVSADASLFTNEMLWHGDNAIAAIRICEMLCGQDRTRVAFQAGGRARAPVAGRLGAEPPPVDTAGQDRALPKPALGGVVQLANVVAQEIVDSNVLNEALQRQPRHMGLRRYFRLTLVIFAALFLIAVVWMLIVNRAHRSVVPEPRKMKAAYEIDKASQGKSSDFRNSVGYLARQFCWELTGSRQARDWQAFLAAQRGAKSALTSAEQQSLARVIDIARRGCQRKLTLGEFQVLGKSMNRLRARMDL